MPFVEELNGAFVLLRCRRKRALFMFRCGERIFTIYSKLKRMPILARW